MSSSALVCRLDANAIPVLGPREWRDQLALRCQLGARCLTLFGHGEQCIRITAVLREADGSLHALRTETSRDQGYPELTTQWPALHCFERELHEQTGLNLAGHPWLKPIRFEGRDRAALDSYPFYRIEGKEVHEVAVGPIHAGVIEPGSFRFQCLGERVLHLEIHLGYQHRGVERLLHGRDPRSLAPWIETIAGDSSIAHTWAYCAALESLADCALDLELEIARAAALELERVAMHLAGLSGLAADLGFLQGASTYGRLRTTAINTTQRLCGSRFGRGALRPGGSRLRLDGDLVKTVRENLELLRADLALIDELFLSSWTVRHRLRGVGVLTEPRARELGIVGLAARASGVPLDARAGAASGAYGAIPIESVTLSDGDCWARARLRCEELGASLRWLAGSVALYPSWQPSRQILGPLAPNQLAIALVEGWRGEVIHCLETDASGTLAHYKVQDPSLRNWMGLAIAMRQNEISDFPICNKSFDLSYCGNDL